MNRLHNLDYLRGMAAFGIMSYHYLFWTLGVFSSDTFMARVGVYGVSLFYVLSGLTLYHVYYHVMLPSKADLSSFMKKRILRLFPLFWVVTFSTLLLKGYWPGTEKLILNLTGLFGFIHWNDYIASGVWSIGNELVFYSFFPLFIFLSKRFKILFIVFSLLIACIYFYFAFYILDTHEVFSEQRQNYTNPLNQLFLFLGGFLIGLIFQNIKIKRGLNLFLFLCGVGLLVFYPVKGNMIYLVTGWNRLWFTLSCFLICLSFYKLYIQFPRFIHRPLTLLGEASYSVYLLHPIVYSSVVMVLSSMDFHISLSMRLILTVVLALIVSYMIYQYFEKYFIRVGRYSKK